MSDLLPVGTIVGQRYEIVDVIGSGGFAVVYRAQHIHMARQLAVKVLEMRLSDTGDQRLAKRFVQEATLASQIDHPNVVTIHDFGFTDDQQPFMVMQLFEGKDLHSHLSDDGAMDPARAQALFAGCLAGLAEAHKRGVVHRDLKPSNLILSPDGDEERLCIVNFGIASGLVTPDDRLTVEGHMLGTPLYFAPEYVSEQIVSPALDVYQMGLILVEALTGQPAIQGYGPAGYVLAHATGELTIPNALLEPPLGPVLARALQRDHDLRYPDAEQFRLALEQVDVAGLGPVTLDESSFVKDYSGPLAARITTEDAPPNTAEDSEATSSNAGNDAISAPASQSLSVSGVRELVFDPATGAFGPDGPGRADTLDLVDGLPSAETPAFSPGEVGVAEEQPELASPVVPQFEAAAIGVAGAEAPDLGRLARMTRRARRGGSLGLVIGFLLLAGLAALGFVVYSVADPAALLVRPEPMPPETRGLLTGELRWKAVAFESADGHSLVGFYGAAFEGRKIGTILYLHGLGDEVGARALAMDTYRDAGFDVLVFGQRGYGESHGEADMAAFGPDALEAYNYLLTKRRARPSRLVVYGRGAGASAAAHLCAERTVGAVVTEGAFTKLSDVLAEHVITMPASWVVSPDLDTASGLRECKRPVFLIHGKDDFLVPPSHSEALYASGRGARLLQLVPGAGHDSLDADEARLPTLLREFLEVQGFGPRP